ncbi:MAG TPA: hypothetical protein VHK88_02010 [Aquihabitans sp.]|nr:hypothetical protein [Aquihabitans sp.]
MEVFSSFDRSWSEGFEIADVREGGYLIRRLSDGFVIPNTTSPTDLREAAPHQ